MNIRAEIKWTKLVLALGLLCLAFGLNIAAQANPVRVRYDAPNDQRLVPYENLLKSGHLLEDLADEINSQIKLPRNLTLVGRQCDQANAFYQPSRQSIEVCYEYLRQFEGLEINDLKDEHGQFDRDEVTRTVLSTIKFSLHHELGHALVDLLNLPITGKEEDSVDQLATVVLLRSGEDADIDAVFDSAYSKILRANQNEAALAKLTDEQRRLREDAISADEHSLDQQRYFDITCMVYGSDPKSFADLVTDGSLPQARAASCPGEWRRISSSWARLLAPFMPGAALNTAGYPPAQAAPAQRTASNNGNDQNADMEEVSGWNPPQGLLPGGGKLAPCEKPLAVKSAWNGLKAKQPLFYGIYCQPVKPDYLEAHEEMIRGHVLEGLANDLNETIRIPKPIIITFRECGQANSFYSPDSNSVVMCYELLNTFNDTFENEGLKGEELDNAVENAVIFAFYHELGHALVDVLKLPITGREEDAVDQLATFIVSDGSDEEETTAYDGANAFLLLAKNSTGRQTEFWDQHSLGEQRFYSILCSLYGDSPQKYASMVTDGVLPKARAVRCGYEWKRIQTSWIRLLTPYVKQN